MNNNYITLTMNVKRPGCYQASITYQGEPIRNGNFTLLVLSGEFLTHFVIFSYIWFICLIVKRIHAFCVLNTFTMFYLSLILVVSKKYWVKRIFKQLLAFISSNPLPHLSLLHLPQFMKVSDLMIKLYQTLSIELQNYCSRCTQA